MHHRAGCIRERAHLKCKVGGPNSKSAKSAGGGRRGKTPGGCEEQEHPYAEVTAWLQSRREIALPTSNAARHWLQLWLVHSACLAAPSPALVCIVSIGERKSWYIGVQ